MTNLIPIDQFKNDLNSQKQMIQEVLPEHIKVEKFIRAAVVAVTNNPDILNKDKQSLFVALQRCAVDGLVPDNKEAALIPFGNKVQYLPMVDGVIKRARQSGEVLTLAARAVYSNDVFEYWIDEDGEHLNHRPKFVGERGELTLVYAMAKLRSGEVIVEPMTIADVEKVRAASRTSNSGPWKDWFERMALKSALHRLGRRLPNSSEIMEMLDAGNFMYDFKNNERDITPRRSTSLANKLAKQQSEPEPVEPESVETLLAELVTLKTDSELAEWTVKAGQYDEDSDERKNLIQEYRNHRSNLKHAESEA